jgi:signal peptidase I
VWHLLAQGQPEQRSWADIIDSLARTPLSQVVLFVGICTALRLAIAPYLSSVEPHRRTGFYGFARVINELLDAVIYAGVFVFLIIRPFCIQAFKIPTGSMLETLQINDFIVANKAIYRYTRPKLGDIVVFRPPSYAVQPFQVDEKGEVKVDYIKRCVGVPGDVIEIRDGVLYRNGSPQKEPYMREPADADFKLVKYNDRYWPLTISGDSVNVDLRTAEPFRLDPSDYATMAKLRELKPAAIPPNHYLMIGDNRNDSFDGRAWGLISDDQVIGRSEFIWLPVSRWGATR